MKELLKKPGVQIAIAIIILLLVFAAYRNAPRWWAQLTKQDRGDYSNPQPSDTRKVELKQMAQRVYTAIDGGGGWTERTDAMEAINVLNDTELRYVATEYEQIASEPLKTAIDDESMPFTDVDSKLIARLTNMGL